VSLRDLPLSDLPTKPVNHRLGKVDSDDQPLRTDGFCRW
jgi:hypothetical protein